MIIRMPIRVMVPAGGPALRSRFEGRGRPRSLRGRGAEQDHRRACLAERDRQAGRSEIGDGNRRRGRRHDRIDRNRGAPGATGRLRGRVVWALVRSGCVGSLSARAQRLRQAWLANRHGEAGAGGGACEHPLQHQDIGHRKREQRPDDDGSGRSYCHEPDIAGRCRPRNATWRITLNPWRGRTAASCPRR